MSEVSIHELADPNDLLAAEKLQLEVWGADTYPESRDFLRAMAFSGGFVAGAFSDGLLVGFCWGFPARDPQVLHSHRLGVLPAWREHGIGAALKQFQRTWCLERGIGQIHWTVDPLRAANAELNFHQLGAVACQYLVDFYGPMEGLDGGTPSDRLLVEWHLSNPFKQPVNARCEDQYSDAVSANSVHMGRPGFTGPADSPHILVHLPADFTRLTREDRPLALLWRLHIRELLLRCFQDGYQIIDFLRECGNALVLQKADSSQ